MERKLSATDLKKLLADGADVTLVDVRRAPARAADPRVIPGAVWRDPDRVGDWADELPPGQPVVVYCVHGHEVSAGVVDRLRERGCDAALLEGGFEGWQAAGGQLAPAGPDNSTSEASSHTDEVVDEASEESFPASDPPSYTPVSGAGRPECD